jgi:hypothetical protein
MANRAYLLEIPGMNMDGDDWEWRIFLTFRKDKTYSVGAKMFSKRSPTLKIATIPYLKNGQDVKEALLILLSDENFMDFLPDETERQEALESCIKEIESHDKNLAKQMRIAM